MTTSRLSSSSSQENLYRPRTFTESEIRAHIKRQKREREMSGEGRPRKAQKPKAKKYYTRRHKQLCLDSKLKQEQINKLEIARRHKETTISTDNRCFQRSAVNPLSKACSAHIERTMELYDFKRASEREQSEWLERIRRLY